MQKVRSHHSLDYIVDVKMKTSGWSELFSDKLIRIDRLEIEGEGGGRYQVLFQLPCLLYLLGDSACHCDKDHWRRIRFGTKSHETCLRAAFEVLLRFPNGYMEQTAV